MKTGVLIKVGEKKPSCWPLLKSKIGVGRGVENDIVLIHPSVSRVHAELERTPEGGWVLVDRDSRNGTRVNGIAIVRRQLREGDLIALGEVTLRFSLMDEEPAESPAECRPDRGDDYRPTLTVSGGGDPLASVWPGLQGWQMVRALLERGLRPPAEYVMAVLEDLTGLRDVIGAGIGLLDKSNGGRCQWFWSPGAPLTFRRRAEAAVNAGRVRESAVSYGVNSRGGIHENPDYLLLPLGRVGEPLGLLTLQGEYPFSDQQVAAFRAVSEALGAILSFATGREEGGSMVPLSPATRGREGGCLVQAPAIVGRSAALQQALRLARKAAATDATVLIRGETGTGKEVFARLIAAESRRNRRPFLPVHCSAIDETLLGSTLFGHEKGAFTGAVGMKRGVFEEADGGTVFLDEIGELTLGMQVRLLRVLQEGEFMRLGGTRPIRVDVRILTATNRDLERAIREGQFREDLFYRLNVVPLVLPPLRDRREDLSDLIGYFLAELAEEMGRPIPTVSAAARARLEEYPWPGNIRELRNVLERALVLAEGREITEDDLPPELGLLTSVISRPGETLAETEREHILRILRECGGNKRMAAQRLGISRSTLYERMRQFGENENVVTP